MITIKNAQPVLRQVTGTIKYGDLMTDAQTKPVYDTRAKRIISQQGVFVG
jgi:hypothetical protein